MNPDDLGSALTGVDIAELFGIRRPAPDRFESRPIASQGGRSVIEVNNPELGPTPQELLLRQYEFEQQNQRR